MKHVQLMGNNTLTVCVVVIHMCKCVIEVHISLKSGLKLCAY